MRALITILFIAVLSGIATYFLPWWMMPICTFLVVVTMRQGPLSGFITGFAGVGLLWTGLILFADIFNSQILATRMAKLFGLPNAAMFMIVNIFLGALIGGLAGWSGGMMYKYFRK